MAPREFYAEKSGGGVSGGSVGSIAGVRRFRFRPLVTCFALLIAGVTFAAEAKSGNTIDYVVLTVDGMPVLFSEVLEMIGLRELTRKEWDAACRELALQKLIEKAATKEEIQVSDEEVDKRLDERLKEAGMTREQVKDSLPAYRRQQKQWLRRIRVVNKRTEGKVVVLPAEVKRFYEEHRDEFRLEEQRHLRMISVLLDKSIADPDAARRTARQKIEALAQQLNEGKDFVSVARSNTNDPYADKGGDLEWTKKGSLVEPIDKAAFLLDVGQVSEIIESPSGYHIIKVEQRQPEYVQPFTDVEERIKRKLHADLYNKKVTELLDSLLEDAIIERFDDGDEPWLKS